MKNDNKFYNENKEAIIEYMKGYLKYNECEMINFDENELKFKSIKSNAEFTFNIKDLDLNVIESHIQNVLKYQDKITRVKNPII